MTPNPSNRRRCFCGGLIALFAVVLCLPLFQQITGTPRDQDLQGFRNQTDTLPAWTPQDWHSGQFAQETDNWIREHAGLRGTLVKLNRQLRYSLFSKLTPAPLPQHAVLIGTGNILHENLYLTEAINPPKMSLEKMELFGERLARLQGLLQEQGMAFLVIAAPNKTRLYPETLPRWAQSRIQADRHDHQAFIAALRHHKVAHLDAMHLFSTLDPAPPGLMAPHSAHWSFHGAWVAWQHAIPLLNRQAILPIIPVPQTAELIWAPALDMDTELQEQLNIFAGRHAEPIPAAYPVAAELPPGSHPPLNALIVGDSYGYGLMDALARSRLCTTLEYWHNVNTFYECPVGSFESREHRILLDINRVGNLRSNDENGQRAMAGKNVVILIMTAFNIDEMSWGFDRLINRLFGDPNDNLPRESARPSDQTSREPRPAS